jgi:hypothetical protein
MIVALIRSGRHGDTVILVEPAIEVAVAAAARTEWSKRLRRRLAAQRARARLDGFGFS